MALAYRLAIFVIICNLAMTMVPWLTPYNAPIGIVGNNNTAAINELQRNVSGFSVDSSSSNFLFRIYDWITLGWLQKLSNTLYNIVFGIVPIIMAISGTYDPVIASTLQGIILLIYVMGVIDTFIGRDPTEK